jgi:dephospho-CoA kinase
MKKIFFIIGASGSGKTTVIKALEKTSPPDFKIFYFDSIGVPSLEEMNAKYNSPEEWQRIKTFEWVKKIKELFVSEINVILDGQIRPEFIEKACVESKSAYETVLFDCTDKVRANRLIARGHPEMANEQMMNWAKYLRQESQKRSYQIIDNTDQTCDETLCQLFKWLKERN